MAEDNKIQSTLPGIDSTDNWNGIINNIIYITLMDNIFSFLKYYT